jgi:hypothetical protein
VFRMLTIVPTQPQSICIVEVYTPEHNPIEHN